MKFEFYCGQCGKTKEVNIERSAANAGMTIRKLIEAAGWIVQINRPHLDIYCSKRCAE